MIISSQIWNKSSLSESAFSLEKSMMTPVEYSQMQVGRDAIFRYEYK